MTDPRCVYERGLDPDIEIAGRARPAMYGSACAPTMRDLTPAPAKARKRSTKSRCIVVALLERPCESGEHFDGRKAVLDRHAFVVGIEFLERLVAEASETRPRDRATTRGAFCETRIIHTLDFGVSYR